MKQILSSADVDELFGSERAVLVLAPPWSIYAVKARVLVEQIEQAWHQSSGNLTVGFFVLIEDDINENPASVILFERLAALDSPSLKMLPNAARGAGSVVVIDKHRPETFILNASTVGYEALRSIVFERFVRTSE